MSGAQDYLPQDYLPPEALALKDSRQRESALIEAQFRAGQEQERARQEFKGIPRCIATDFARWPNDMLQTPGGWGSHCFDIVTFFAGMDLRRPAALRMWELVASLTGEGDAFEREAALLLHDVILHDPRAWRHNSWGRLTRSDLRQRDKNVIGPAKKLISALCKHPELQAVPSSRYWERPALTAAPDEAATAAAAAPQSYAEKLRDGLRGAQCHFSYAFVHMDEPYPNDDDPDRAAWFVAHNAPPMWMMLDRLCVEVEALAARRTKDAPKVSKQGEISWRREIVNGLQSRHPGAASALVAQITASIIRVRASDDSTGRTGKQAQRSRRKTPK